jgi:glyoxylase-like metal-dependent hydrolase (beta-lactamase superfamily II)
LHHRKVEPTVLVEGSKSAMSVGAQEIELMHLGQGHTIGDLVVRVVRSGVIATGNLIFNRYYCYMDMLPEGISVPGVIEVLRRLAYDYPEAIFMPGHGPIARATDLLRQAAYLEDLMQQVADARASGKSSSAAVAQVDLARWDLEILPVTFHGLEHSMGDRGEQRPMDVSVIGIARLIAAKEIPSWPDINLRLLRGIK